MLRLALQGLRGRKGPFAGAFIALAAAAAIVMACGALLQAGVQSTAPVERLSGAPIVVAGVQKAAINAGTQNADSVSLTERARVPADLVARVAAVPGVRAAIVDTATPAELRGPSGAVAGPAGHAVSVHPWESAALTPYRLTSGRGPTRPGHLVVAADMARRGGLQVGSRVRLASNGPVQAMTVTGIAAPSADVERQGVLFVTGPEAARLGAVPGRVDAIGVLPERGADRAALTRGVRAAVGHHARVVTGDDRGEVEHLESIEAKDAVIAIAATFGSLALLIAMFVVSSTLGLSVMQREREVALLRAVAATPRQVRRMIGIEAVLVGLLASAVGVVPGALLAGALGGALSDHGIAPEDMVVTAGPIPILVAVVGSVVTAAVAVIAAGRRAARVQPTVALRDAAAESRVIGPIRLLLGLLCLGGAVALAEVAATSGDAQTTEGVAAGMSLTLIIGVALLGPVVARAAAIAVGPLLRSPRTVNASLAVSNVRTSPRRFASAMTPLVLCVGLSCTLLFQTTTREHATEGQASKRVVADHVLGSDGVGVPASAIDAARGIRGASAVVETTTTTLGPGLGTTQQPIQAAVVGAGAIERVLDLDVQHGSLRRFADGAVALSEGRAEQADATVGDRVAVMLGDGSRRTLEVAAIYGRGLGFGEVLLPAATVAGHLTSPLMTSVLVRSEDGAADAVGRRLDALAARYPGMTVGDRHDIAVSVDENREANDWLFRILTGIVFVFAAIAVVNTLMMIGAHRTRELGLLRLVGGTSRQVRAMARWEAGMVVGLGVGLGGLVALITLVPTSETVSGSSVPYAPIGLVALVLGSAAAVGFAGSALATRLALRVRPVDAIGMRE